MGSSLHLIQFEMTETFNLQELNMFGIKLIETEILMEPIFELELEKTLLSVDKLS